MCEDPKALQRKPEWIKGFNDGSAEKERASINLVYMAGYMAGRQFGIAGHLISPNSPYPKLAENLSSD